MGLVRFKNILYFFYYLKKIDSGKFYRFSSFVSDSRGLSKWMQIFGIVNDCLVYKISILEYYYFGFYDLTPSEKREWAGTGFMYEYQLLMNPKQSRNVLEDKRLFRAKYDFLIKHRVVLKSDLKSIEACSNFLESLRSEKIVLKHHDGNCGVGIKIIDLRNIDKHSLFKLLKSNNYEIIEEYIMQHPLMNNLSPSGVNTVRIFTQLDGLNNVDILGCRLRISIDSSVDNMAAGNIAAPIDITTGRIIGAGVYSDITKEEVTVHPITGVELIGFQIPFWKETVEMSIKAALTFTDNRSVGWDIAITSQGPTLIEGNHDWCKLLWQLPIKSGMKHILLEYL